MATRITWWRSGVSALILSACAWSATPACCPAPSEGSFAINADQTVVILWDAARKTQHFIRQASFRSNARDFGFLIPSPAKPELAESGNEAFPYLTQVTEPAVQYRKRARYSGCACSEAKTSLSASGSAAVNVVHEQRVAGFDAVVLSASSSDALVGWLKDHGYAYSPQVAAWAKPYVERGWMITALKVAKPDGDAKQTDVEASALRMSFATDAPLFPYREPDYGSAVTADARRTLRIFFLGDARYGGAMGTEKWSGRAVWSDVLKPEQRTALLTKLKLPEDAGPATMRLTEFEDNWAYRVAPADVEFTVAADQSTLHRPDVILYTQSKSWLPEDATAYLIVAAVVMPVVACRRRRRETTSE